jgi:TonB family protein
VRRLVFIAGLLVLLVSIARAETAWVSVVDFGNTPFAQQTAEKLRERLRTANGLKIADADLTRSAAKGIGYSGSLNLSVREARDLGAALSTEFYVLGDTQNLRRSSFKRPVYYESYCSLFVVSSRTGRLITWERPSVESDKATEAETSLLEKLSSAETFHRIIISIQRAREDEQALRMLVNTNSEPLIEEAPEDDKAAEVQGIRLPRPYRRLRPEYPASAARAEAEGTVDVLVDVGADGEVSDVRVARWAGFGLDETTVATVRKMHFFPAMKNGTAIAMRVLLRYNFRKPPR